MAEKKKKNKVTSWIVTCIILALIVLSVRTFHIHAFVIQSGSMEPKIKVGSVLITAKPDNMTFEEGDIISFVKEGNVVVTHRIDSIEDKNGAVVYKTKGDANEKPDAGTLSEQNIIGKALFYIPYIGYPNVWFKSHAFS